MSEDRTSEAPPGGGVGVPPEATSVPPPAKPDDGDGAAPLPSGVDDANDLRSHHFRRLARKRVTLILSGLAALGAGIFLATINLALAPVGIAGVALFALLAVFALADRAAENDFFKIYAKQRALALLGDGRLPPVTPLLRKGDERKAEQVMRGPMADGVEGTLAHYTYTDVYYDKNGRHESHYPFTVALVDIPASVEHCPELFCNRRFGLKALEKLEDVFRSNERVKLESVKLDDRFEIFADEKQDQNWLRQLFSPSFIVWLAEETPEKFAFELVAGALCCNVRGHKETAAELDQMRTAAAGVARRLIEECAEGRAPGSTVAPQGAS